MIFTIFKKELLETLRDKRTIIFMMVIPALLFPVIIKLTSSFSNSMGEKAAAKTLHVGYVGQENELLDELKKDNGEVGKYTWKKFDDTSKVKRAIQDGDLHLGIYFKSDYNQDLLAKKPVQVNLIFDGTDIGYKERIEARIQSYNAMKSQQRMEDLKIDAESLNVLTLDETNVASDQEMFGKMIGGMLPYIFIIFSFIGCMYPAIDLFTGEKERGTVETLLTTPVARWKILTGKMLVVILSGILAAAFSLGGLYFAISDLSTGPKMAEISDVVSSFFSVKSLLLMALLLLPLIIFFAGLMVPITVYAKSFKEAQSVLTPLNMAVLIPAMISTFPGIEYNISTAFIPVMNVVLATKEVIAGTIDMTLYCCTLFSLVAFAVLAVLLSNRQFGKESNISSN